jgi:two-component system chemotaxis response regulator CheB
MEPIRALAVDDSAVYRRVVGKALEGIAGIRLIGTAAHGREALAVLGREPVDLITLDLEMPELDGVGTLRALRLAGHRTRVIVLSAMSRAGADLTIQAMAAGADDFLLKPVDDGTPGVPQTAADRVRQHLLPKIQQFWGWLGSAANPSTLGAHADVAVASSLNTPFWPKVIVVASSTGGPAALEAFLSKLPAVPSCPIVLAQHMPALFTASLAVHLSSAIKRPVVEATNGQTLENGRIYIVPGDFHMRLVRRADRSIQALLDQGEKRNFVRPSADYLFESAAQIYGRYSLGIVLTGMGSDGRDGALALKQAGGRVLIQSKESCAVFGMPKAVQDAGAADVATDLAGLASLVRTYTAA